MTGDDVEELADYFRDNADDDAILDARLEATKWRLGPRDLDEHAEIEEMVARHFGNREATPTEAYVAVTAYETAVDRYLPD